MLTFAMGAGEEEEGGGVEAEPARKTEQGKKKSVVVGKKDGVKESSRGRKDEGKVGGTRKGSWHSHIKPPSRAQEVAIGGEFHHTCLVTFWCAPFNKKCDRYVVAIS